MYYNVHSYTHKPRQLSNRLPKDKRIYLHAYHARVSPIKPFIYACARARHYAVLAELNDLIFLELTKHFACRAARAFNARGDLCPRKRAPSGRFMEEVSVCGGEEGGNFSFEVADRGCPDSEVMTMMMGGKAESERERGREMDGGCWS